MAESPTAQLQPDVSRERDRLTWEVRLRYPQFEEALNHTLTKCVRRPDDFDTVLDAVAENREARYQTGSTEAPLLRKLGSYGLYATELIREILQHDPAMPHGHTVDAIVRPEAYSLEADPWVTTRIEAFGRMYLQEMLGALGPLDADKPGDTKHQLQLIDALILERIPSFGTQDDPRFKHPNTPYFQTVTADKDLHDRFFYHPDRLSPLVLGTYPEHTGVRPTCFAQAALSAAYYNHMGWPNMLANAAKIAELDGMQRISEAVEMIRDSVKINGIRFGANDEFNVLKLAHDMRLNAKSDMGLHYANLVRLHDGRWMMTDATRRIRNIYSPEDSLLLDQHYMLLEAASAEDTPLAIPYSEQSDVIVYEDAAEACAGFGPHLPQHDEIERQLTRKPFKSYESLVDGLIMPVFDKSAEGIRHDGIWATADQLAQRAGFDGDGRAYLRELTISRLKTSALNHSDTHPGACWTKCLSSAQQQPASREALTEWISSAPYMIVILAMTADYNHAYTEGVNPRHPFIELGMPFYTVGASVLSEHMNHYFSKPHERMPAAFWATYLPNRVGVLTHTLDAKRTPSYYLFERVLRLMLNVPRNLRDPSKADRVKTFLDKGAPVGDSSPQPKEN